MARSILKPSTSYLCCISLSFRMSFIFSFYTTIVGIDLLVMMKVKHTHRQASHILSLSRRYVFFFSLCHSSSRRMQERERSAFSKYHNIHWDWLIDIYESGKLSFYDTSYLIAKNTLNNTDQRICWTLKKYFKFKVHLIKHPRMTDVKFYMDFLLLIMLEKREERLIYEVFFFLIESYSFEQWMLQRRVLWHCLLNIWIFGSVRFFYSSEMLDASSISLSFVQNHSIDHHFRSIFSQQPLLIYFFSILFFSHVSYKMDFYYQSFKHINIFVNFVLIFLL